MGGLPIPVALWTLAVVGMLWAHAPLAERIVDLLGAGLGVRVAT